MKRITLLLTSLAVAAPLWAADVYDLDTAHTMISFSIKHMVITTTRGKFDKFKGSFEVDPADPSTLKAQAVIEAASIDTGTAKRDDHLRSDAFFDVARYPEITFQSTHVERSGDGFVLTGDLTMHGVTKAVVIPITIGGAVTDWDGHVHYGFEGSTKIDRKEWGLTWNKKLDNGGLVVGDEVTIEISVEGIKHEAAPAAR